MYKVELTNIKSDHEELRTDVISGTTVRLPTEGVGFQMFGEGLEFGTRIITTTAVEFVEYIDQEYKFNTKNSLYTLKVLEEISK